MARPISVCRYTGSFAFSSQYHCQTFLYYLFKKIKFLFPVNLDFETARGSGPMEEYTEPNCFQGELETLNFSKNKTCYSLNAYSVIPLILGAAGWTKKINVLNCISILKYRCCYQIYLATASPRLIKNSFFFCKRWQFIIWI